MSNKILISSVNKSSSETDISTDHQFDTTGKIDEKLNTKLNLNDAVGQKYKVSNVNKGEIFNDYTNNVASGDYSTAKGLGTTADQANMTVVGKYNTTGNTNALFVVGNGTSTTRNDAFVVKSTGDAIVSNDLTISNALKIKDFDNNSNINSVDKIKKGLNTDILNNILNNDTLPTKGYVDEKTNILTIDKINTFFPALHEDKVYQISKTYDVEVPFNVINNDIENHTVLYSKAYYYNNTTNKLQQILQTNKRFFSYLISQLKPSSSEYYQPIYSHAHASLNAHEYLVSTYDNYYKKTVNKRYAYKYNGFSSSLYNFDEYLFIDFSTSYTNTTLNMGSRVNFIATEKSVTYTNVTIYNESGTVTTDKYFRKNYSYIITDITSGQYTISIVNANVTIKPYDFRFDDTLNTYTINTIYRAYFDIERPDINIRSEDDDTVIEHTFKELYFYTYLGKINDVDTFKSHGEYMWYDFTFDYQLNHYYLCCNTITNPAYMTGTFTKNNIYKCISVPPSGSIAPNLLYSFEEIIPIDKQMIYINQDDKLLIFINNSWHNINTGTFDIENNINSNYMSEVFNAYDGTNKALGPGVHIEGADNSSNGRFTHVEGHNNLALWECAHAEGKYTRAIYDTAHAEGYKTEAYSAYSHAEGNGTSTQGQSSHAEGSYSTAAGNSSHAEGYDTIASGAYSHSEGNQTSTSGTYAHSEGYHTTAIGNASHSEGNYCVAKGLYSHAEGILTTANGQDSHAGGYCSYANGNTCFAHGYFVNANHSNNFVIGYYNKDPASTDLFIIGNGSQSTHSNAFRVNRGTQGTAGGPVYGGTYNNSGADYAELFEAYDKTLSKDKYKCRFITIDNDKVKIANNTDDYILGVYSSEPVILGNSPIDYAHRYKRDENNDIIYENIKQLKTEFRDIEHKKNNNIELEKNEIELDKNTKEEDKYEIVKQAVINENYDPNKEYIDRVNRDDWIPVGLLGKLLVLDYGTCEVNKYCKVGPDGSAVPYNKEIDGNIPHWRVIKRFNDKRIFIIFK